MSVFPGRRALIVDDSRAARIEVASLVEPYGFDVDLAEDGGAALRRLEERAAYDVVLVDVRMPTLDGHELLRIMRARANFSPVVVMTGRANASQVTHILKLGATDLLLKPFEPARVREALARALNLPVEALRAEAPLALVEGSEIIATALRAGLPEHVQLDRVEPGEVGAAVSRRACRLVVIELGAAYDSPRRDEAVAAAAATAAAIRELQPCAALCLVTPDGGTVPGFDACLTADALTAAAADSLYPNALRPLVTYDDEYVGIMGFRGAVETEGTYFALAARRLRAAVALQAAADTPHLTVDLSRVPTRTAAVERLAAEAVAATAGRVPGLLFWVTPALRSHLERLGLPAHVDTPDWRATARGVFRWTPDLSVGVEAIDEQHQRLFERLGQVLSALHADGGPAELADGLRFLLEYAAEHFADEEALMVEVKYPELEAHRAQHRHFRDLLAAAQEEVRRGSNRSLMARAERDLCEWLYRHVHRVDRAFGHHVQRRA